MKKTNEIRVIQLYKHSRSLIKQIIQLYSENQQIALETKINYQSNAFYINPNYTLSLVDYIIEYYNTRKSK